MDSSTWFGYIDLGDMLLNYILDEELRPYGGVDVSELFNVDSSSSKAIIERWERNLMGLCSSLFTCTHTFGWGDDVICGDHLYPSNTMGWEKVILNIPGYKGYDPTKSWVYCFNGVIRHMDSFFTTYIDDIRTGSHSKKSCRYESLQVDAGVNYLVHKDASRKQRVPAKRPVYWAGMVCFSDEAYGVYVTFSQEKWYKVNHLVEGFYNNVVIGGKYIFERKELENSVGFLVHLSRTFPALFPYFKGIYLTMEYWQIRRSSYG